MKKCETCHYADATHGIFCPTCAAVEDIMAIIFRHYFPNELEQLVKRYRSDSVDNLLTRAKANNSPVSAKIYTQMKALSSGLNESPDLLKSKVCNAINLQISGEKSKDSHDKEHGEGNYTASAVAWIEKHIQGSLKSIKVK